MVKIRVCLVFFRYICIYDFVNYLYQFHEFRQISVIWSLVQVYDLSTWGVYIFTDKNQIQYFLHGLNFIADPWLLNIAARKESVRHQGHHLVTRSVYPDQVNYRCSLRAPMAALTLFLLTLGTVAATDILIGRYHVITLYVPFR